MAQDARHLYITDDGRRSETLLFDNLFPGSRSTLSQRKRSARRQTATCQRPPYQATDAILTDPCHAKYASAGRYLNVSSLTYLLPQRQLQWSTHSHTLNAPSGLLLSLGLRVQRMAGGHHSVGHRGGTQRRVVRGEISPYWHSTLTSRLPMLVRTRLDSKPSDPLSTRTFSNDGNTDRYCEPFSEDSSDPYLAPGLLLLLLVFPLAYGIYKVSSCPTNLLQASRLHSKEIEGMPPILSVNV